MNLPSQAGRSGLVEVRVPTYRRPVFLRRALTSLVAQSHGDWQALVLDDSPDREAERVLAEFNDPRIVYLPNDQNLGCAGNLDRAFQTAAYVGGEFACVLEDDNELLPDFLAANVEILSRTNVNILQRNQFTWHQSPAGDYVDTGGTTLVANWKEGLVSPLRLAAMLVCRIPISNGGLFWRCSAKSDLAVGDVIKDGGMQEYVRAFQIVEPVYCCMQPLARYTVMDETTRGGVPYRQAARFQQLLSRALYQRHGRPLIDEVFAYERDNPRARASKWLAHDLLRIGPARDFKYLVKGAVISVSATRYSQYFSAGAPKRLRDGVRELPGAKAVQNAIDGGV